MGASIAGLSTKTMRNKPCSQSSMTPLPNAWRHGLSRKEATRPILELLKEVVSTRGTFISLYTDRAGHFVYTPKAGEPPDRTHKTQIEQVLDELGIELIVAYSPEARGRSERAFGTMQGRIVPELRRASITTYEDANRYLRELYISKYNKRFGVKHLPNRHSLHSGDRRRSPQDLLSAAREDRLQRQHSPSG